jgi:hypothetical protein
MNHSSFSGPIQANATLDAAGGDWSTSFLKRAAVAVMGALAASGRAAELEARGLAGITGSGDRAAAAR